MKTDFFKINIFFGILFQFSGKSSVLSLVVDKSSFTEKLNHQISKFFFRNVQTLDVLKQKRSLCNRLFEVARAAAETQCK